MENTQTSRVWFVGAGAGDPELLTLKAVKLLEKATCCIWAGSLVNPELLKMVPESCDIHDSASMNLDQIMEVIKDHTSKGHDVIRLHTGDPSIYGATGEQMRRLDELAIPYAIVPGVSSFQASAAAVQTELTLPEISQSIVLTRTAGRTPMPDGQELEAFAKTKATLCVFLSASKLQDICDRLKPYYGDDCTAALVFHASWPDQEVQKGTLNTLPGQCQHITRTAMLLVGDALGNNGPDSKLYDATFSHGYRQA
jgi:precorrin-4/cobalt-precorrin-4 C11-methyltransferase